MTTTTAPNRSTVVDVINAGTTSGLASQVSHTLKQHGYTVGEVRDRASGDPTTTALEYGPGTATDAQNLAALLGINAPNRQDPAVKAGHVKVVVDDNYSVPSDAETTTTSKTSSSYYGSSAAASTEPTPNQGKPIDSGGVPCVN